MPGRSGATSGGPVRGPEALVTPATIQLTSCCALGAAVLAATLPAFRLRHPPPPPPARSGWTSWFSRWAPQTCTCSRSSSRPRRASCWPRPAAGWTSVLCRWGRRPEGGGGRSCTRHHIAAGDVVEGAWG